MTLKDKLIFGAVVVVVAIAAVFGASSFIGGNGSVPSFGAVGNLLAENYIPYVRTNGGYNSADPINTSALMSTTGTFSVGSSGSTISQYNFGTCAIWGAHTITASTTKTVDCATGAAHTALTGITSTDNVMVQATTSISSTYLGVRIVSAHASTTAGYITLQLYNGTGTTFTWTGTASSTIAYQAVK